MDEDLRRMWQEINEAHFDGQLEPLAAIDWGPISGDHGIDAFGVFFPSSKCIVIAERFRPDRDATPAGEESEKAKVEVAYRLLIHEMIHQALYQQNAPRPGGHGSSFVDEARRIADQLGGKQPTEEDACRWPDIAGILAQYPI